MGRAIGKLKNFSLTTDSVVTEKLSDNFSARQVQTLFNSMDTMEMKLNNLKLHTDLSTVDPLVLARVLMKVKNVDLRRRWVDQGNNKRKLSKGTKLSKDQLERFMA